MVEPRRFDFRVDTDVFTGGVVQPLNKLYFLFESVNAEVRFAHRETSRIDLHLLAVFDLKTFGKFQRTDFRQRKVDGVITAIFTGAVRETFRHIRHAIQIMIMQDNQLVVLRHHQILLQIVRALSIGHRFCRKRVLRQITARATVGDNNFIGRQRGAGHQPRQQQASR